MRGSNALFFDFRTLTVDISDLQSLTERDRNHVWYFRRIGH